MAARRIVITGVTRGLGRAMAEEFARLGHAVAGCGRSPEGVARLTQAYGPPHRFDAVGVANAIRHFVPSMAARGNGVIVAMSSGWGRSADADVAPYCASKWAIEGLMRALAQELPAGMAAVPLNPGIIDTDMLRSTFGEGAGGYPVPAEWARAAVPFLLKLGAKDNGRPLTAPQR